MIESPRALRIPVSDLALARWWYSQAFGTEPRSADAQSIQFDVQGFAVLLRLDTSAAGAAPVVYWGVPDVLEEQQRLLALQAGTSAALPVLPGSTEAVVHDPFGNPFGLTTLGEAGLRRTRSQRAAEKIALRNVRSTLDQLQQEEQQQKAHSRMVLRAGLAVLGLLVLVALASGLRDRRPTNTPADALAVPHVGR